MWKMKIANHSILFAFYGYWRIIKLPFNKHSAPAVHTEGLLDSHCPCTSCSVPKRISYEFSLKSTWTRLATFIIKVPASDREALDSIFFGNNTYIANYIFI